MSKIKLRKWQEIAGSAAEKGFGAGREIWVTEACTGSGKTVHGADVGRRLFDNDTADLAIVVTPSIATRSGWIRTLTSFRFNATDNPDYFSTTDFNALVISYGGLARLKAALYYRPVYRGIFLVVDEYHHAEEDAAWGTTVSILQQDASRTLFLSGTPWRSTGQIAVLATHKNVKGNPYYNGDRVDADYKHTYRKDLNQNGDDRGTVTVNFEFQDSTFTDSKGRVEELVNPHLRQLPKEAREDWIKKAMVSDIRLGKHVRTQSNGAISTVDYQLSKCQLVRDLLQIGCDKLERHRVMAGSRVPVLLVVAQSIKEANAINQYLINVKNLRSALIVSDKDTASDEIAAAQEKAQSGLLDVIVSVGMVSEGVDIPQIKGVVYLSGILTLLYMVQVIGRLLRRIRVGDGYMDSSVNHLPGFFVAPAAPKLVACAYRIEEEMAEAARAAKSNNPPAEPGEPKPEPISGVASTTGDRESIYRGSEDNADWQRAVATMVSHERAEACHVDRFWAEWILSMILRGDRTAWEEARRQAEDRCQCLGLSLSDLLSKAVSVAETTLSMEQQHRLASREAEAIRNRLRWMVEPYKSMEDSGAAYKEVNRAVSSRSGLRGSFTNASIEEKRRWIEVANEMLARSEVAV